MGWGLALKKWRQGQGLKQGAVAELLGVDQATVSRWETNRGEPNLGFKRRIMSMMSSVLNADPQIDILIKQVRESERALVLTEPGIAKNAVMSPAAATALRVPMEVADDYDWEMGPITPQQARLYGEATQGLQLFEDRRIMYVETECSVCLPDMAIVHASMRIVPIPAPFGLSRLLAHVVAVRRWDGGTGTVAVRRLAEPVEVVSLPNE